MNSTITPATADAADSVLVLTCRACGKRHRVKEFPRDPCGNLAGNFLFNCIGCGKTEVRTRSDIIQLAASPRPRPQVTPSRSP